MKANFLPVLLYVAVSSVWAQTESGVSTTKATVVTSGPKKIVSSDLPEDYYLATVSNEPESRSTTLKPIDEIPHLALRSQETSKIPPSIETEDFVYKPQKLRKKILVSNLKNISDKIILANDKYDKQIFLKPVVNATTEATNDGNDENGNSTVKPEEDSKKNIVQNESRSFNENDSEESINGKGVANKNKLIATATESSEEKMTTSSYMFRTISEIQKILNNNFLNVNEAYEARSKLRPSIESIRSSPQTTVVIPETKTTSISNDNSVRNAIRFESDYYGPTGQTDWVPIVPENISGPEKVSPTTATPKIFSTTQRIRVQFPGDEGKKTTQENNFIPLHGSEPEKLDKPTSESNNVEDKTARPLNRLFNKHRGNVRYRPQLNSSEENFRTKKLNSTDSFSEMSLPSTGASWTLATLGGPSSTRFTRKPAENSTLLVKAESVNFSNETEEVLSSSQERLKLDNVTKEQSQVLKNTIPDSVPTVVTVKYNESRVSAKKEEETTTKGKIEEVVETTTFASVNEISSELATRLKTSTTESIIAEETTLPTVATMRSRLRSTTTTTTSTTTAATTTTSTTMRPMTPTEDFSEISPTSFEILKTIHTTKLPVPESSSQESISSTSTEKVSEIPTTRKVEIPKTRKVETPTTEEIPMTTIPAKEQEVVYTTTEDVPNTTFKIKIQEDTDFITESSTEHEITTPRHYYPVEFEFTKTTTSAKPTTTVRVSTVTSYRPRTTSTEKEESPLKPTIVWSGDEVNVTIPEKGVYYNYVPVVKPHDDITEENVPAYLRLTIQTQSWKELCSLKEDLRNAIIHMLTNGTNLTVTADHVVFLNLNEKNCFDKIQEISEEKFGIQLLLPVNMFLMDDNGDFDKNLSEAFLTIWGRDGLNFELPIKKVDFVTPIVEVPEDSLGGSVVAAIVISCVAGACVILLGILFVVMKRRQKRFNYGQRCTPVSLDAYSLDSVSIHNSVRRKGIRASKRSYGNAAFDDSEIPSHPMNFAGLANFSSDKEQLYEEFNIIPQVSPKTEELPAGAETKNRYANVIPLPETRVHLTVKDNDTLSDYINANYVRGPKGAEKLYIACQAPMDSTVEDFWRMIWEQQCKVIIMLTDLQENGVEKCADYLPPNEVTDNLRLFGDFQITLKKRDVKEKYIISYLKIKNMEGNLWREVTHLWYLGWPEQGVPSEANSLIAFLIEARSQMKTQTGSATSGPAVVHCSPGTGRTGTVIACDLCIREFEQTRMVDIPKCVFNLRRDRAGAVQTKDQYAFIYQVLNLYATKLTGGGLESI